MKDGIEQKSIEVKEECLDICTELFKRFGLIILRQPNLVDKVTQVWVTLSTRFGLIILRQPNLVDKVTLMNAINN